MWCVANLFKKDAFLLALDGCQELSSKQIGSLKRQDSFVIGRSGVPRDVPNRLRPDFGLCFSELRDTFFQGVGSRIENKVNLFRSSAANLLLKH